MRFTEKELDELTDKVMRSLDDAPLPQDQKDGILVIIGVIFSAVTCLERIATALEKMADGKKT